MAIPADDRQERRRFTRRRGAPYGENAGADGHARQPRGDLRRQQIIEAAVELFASKGYRGTGVAALADRVGMTATGLLYYFGTKERLLREVGAERDRMDAIDPNAAFPLQLTLSSLRDIGRHNIETAILTRLYLVLGTESLDSADPLHDFFVERYETGRQFVRALLNDEKGQGESARTWTSIRSRSRSSPPSWASSTNGSLIRNGSTWRRRWRRISTS